MIEIQDLADGFVLIEKRGSRVVRETSFRQPEERLLDLDALLPFNPHTSRDQDAPK